MEIVSAQDFFRDAHLTIFLRLLELEAERVEIDFLTLKDCLARYGELDTVGGPAYLASLTDGVPHQTHVRLYAEIVRREAAQRNIIHVTNKALAAAYEGSLSPSAIIETTERL